MACNLAYDDSPMDVAQLFTYVRHRYAGLQAFYLKERDLLAIPIPGTAEETIDSIRELAARKGLACGVVCAAWPELTGPELFGPDGAAEYLIVYGLPGSP